jgi:hypothetical protein
MREYQDLSDEQIDVLFLYHVMRPTDEELREFYRQEVRAEQVASSVPIEELKKLGYTDEQIAEIKATVPLALRRKGE